MKCVTSLSNDEKRSILRSLIHINRRQRVAEMEEEPQQMRKLWGLLNSPLWPPLQVSPDANVGRCLDRKKLGNNDWGQNGGFRICL